MSFWEEPELPKVQKMPRAKRLTAEGKAPFTVGRGVAALAGLVFAVIAALGVWQSLQDTSGQTGSFRSLMMLMPAAMLVRYAWTGQIKALK